MRSSCLAGSAFIFLSLFAVAPAVGQQQALTAPADQAAVDRGKDLAVQHCGFCHGTNARGGSGGPDLTRSVVVQEDENGRQLGAFLRAGRPERGMPKFELPDGQVADIAAFLHGAIYLNANRRLYKILDIVVGDASAGQAYFNGAGRCTSCHSPTGDLKGVGAKYDPATLQGRFLLPRGRSDRRGAAPPPLYLDPTAIKVSVTLPSGETASGSLVRLTDFDVTLHDTAAGRVRSFLRNGDTPKVVTTDPLQAHLDHLAKWTDTEMHNMTAYLVSLK